MKVGVKDGLARGFARVHEQLNPFRIQIGSPDGQCNLLGHDGHFLGGFRRQLEEVLRMSDRNYQDMSRVLRSDAQESHDIRVAADDRSRAGAGDNLAKRAGVGSAATAVFNQANAK
jgi:hypothetical protein